MAREGVPLPVIQRQLGHAHLGVTSTYLRGIDTTEIINAIHARPAAMIPANAGLRLQTTRRPDQARANAGIPRPAARSKRQASSAG
jgi:hypothetical protein